MAVEERATQLDDLYLLEIFKNPVLFTEFTENYDKLEGEEPFELSTYQKEMLMDFNSYISIVAGRSAGKTVTIVAKIKWTLVYNLFPDDYIVYHVPNKVHLEPVWSGLIRAFRTNTVLKLYIPPNSGINSSDFTLKLTNQALLMCRIAGQTGTGVSVIGIHSPLEFVDESGYYPWGTWIEMQPTVNTFTPGFQLIVSGVPDGRREKSVNYHCDQENSNYSKHRISSLKNPRFTEEDRQRAIEQYGGEDSDDYIHLVLAQHGKPVFALFDRTMFLFDNAPVYKSELNGLNLGEQINEYYNRIAILPAVPDRSAKTLIGIDLGYTEPSAFIVMYLDHYGRIHFHQRIKLDKVAFPIQEKLINLLDDKYDPIVIGMDKGAGGQGISVFHHLTQDNEYIHKNYLQRLVAIDFSSSITLGVGTEGQEIKSAAKPFATSVLQDFANNHKLVFSNTDLEMVSELERMTYSKTPSGNIVYKTLTMKGGQKGSDHFTTALLCGILAYYLTNEFIQSKPEKKKLFKPTWVR